MPEKELNATLEQLHEQLSAAAEIDEQTLGKMKVVLDDIRELLSRNSEDRDVAPVQGSLQDLLTKSEVEHPQLVGLLRRLADGLANLGI